MSTLIEALDRSHPTGLPDHLRVLHFGRVLAGHLPQQLSAKDPAASSYEVATLERVGLPDYAKAAYIERAIARTSGNSVTGELSVQAYGATPSTGQVAVSPSGDVVVLAADQITSLDVYYRPVCGDVVELTLAVATGVLTLPSSVSGKALLLLEAEVMTVSSGSNTGKKIILVPASGVVATTKAALAIDRTKVYFNDATDHAATARVKLLVTPALDLAAALASSPATL